MQYFCLKCHHTFNFDDCIQFCPYCGFRLGSNTTAASEQNNEKKTELIRSYFSNTTVSCIAILNAYDKQFEEYIASKLAVSEYEKIIAS